MNTPIELPPEIVEFYFENDSVRVLCSPPAGLSLSEQAKWAIAVFPLPVCKVEPVSENGRMILAVYLGSTKTDTGEPPRTFRLVPPPQKGIGPEVTLTVNGKPFTPPPPPPPPMNRGTCSKPVRVYPDTHEKVVRLSKRLGVGVADTIDKAVSLLDTETSV